MLHTHFEHTWSQHSRNRFHHNDNVASASNCALIGQFTFVALKGPS